MTSTYFELDDGLQEVASAGIEATLAGAAMTGELPSGYDVFLMSNLVHYWSPEQNCELLQRVRRAAGAGSHLLLADFWTDPTRTEPLEAALLVGAFAVHLRNADVYSVEEIHGWLDGSGWRFIRHVPLAGPQSLVVAEAA